MPPDEMSNGQDRPHPADASLRELAASGRLFSAAEDSVAQADLRGAAYTVAWPLVWHRHTRRMEIRKGHPACATSLRQMTDPCLDRFEDDVDAVVDYLLAHGKRPIHNLEGWITSRITMATVDGHRKRRGARGALQRVRIPGWLSSALGSDTWLVGLAGWIIEWVGVAATAGTELWPLGVWAERYALVTGDPAGAAPTQVARDVERVLGVMRRVRPAWYAAHIERPLGLKQPSAVGIPTTDHEPADAARLRAERADDRLVALAAAATDAISDALAAGEDPAAVVPRVIRALFLSPANAATAIDALPGEDLAAGTERLTAVLADERPLGKLVDDVIAIVSATGTGLGHRDGRP